jgi:hypothetical protein
MAAPSGEGPELSRDAFGLLDGKKAVKQRSTNRRKRGGNRTTEVQSAVLEMNSRFPGPPVPRFTAWQHIANTTLAALLLLAFASLIKHYGIGLFAKIGDSPAEAAQIALIIVLFVRLYGPHALRWMMAICDEAATALKTVAQLFGEIARLIERL